MLENIELVAKILVGFAIGGVIGWAIDKYLAERRKKKRSVEAEQTQPHPTPLEAALDSVEHHTAPKMRVGVIEAINGRILEVSTAIPHPMHRGHYDWKTEMYVVPQEQKLSEAIAVLMLMKGLEK